VSHFYVAFLKPLGFRDCKLVGGRASHDSCGVLDAVARDVIIVRGRQGCQRLTRENPGQVDCAVSNKY